MVDGEGVRDVAEDAVVDSEAAKAADEGLRAVSRLEVLLVRKKLIDGIQRNFGLPGLIALAIVSLSDQFLGIRFSILSVVGVFALARLITEGLTRALGLFGPPILGGLEFLSDTFRIFIARRSGDLPEALADEMLRESWCQVLVPPSERLGKLQRAAEERRTFIAEASERVGARRKALPAGAGEAEDGPEEEGQSA